ncbi:MAG TPA: ATP-binding cassette domain-containing protein [Deltaproteobacteria bacterium]|nr:ATP-binding cassette domain-containing protein [Deltaproteobacteria bacterium]
MIRVQQLTKVYGTTLAIDRLEFSIERGEIVGFLGPNGAGKSTTMRILCGSLGATSGSAQIDGLDVFEQPRAVKRLIGYLPEVPPLYTEMTVRSFLRFCARVKEAAEPDRQVEQVIERVGLSSVAHRLIEHLSKGFRQRVGLAQALVHAPRVLVLDEPSSGLDPAQRVEIRELVRELSQGETTVVLSTHVLQEVEAVCDRVIIIHEGHIVAQDSVEALSGSGTAIQIRVARPGPEVLAALEGVEGVVAVQASEGGRYRVSASTDVREHLAACVVPFGLLELSGQRALEDVFLRLTGEAA